MGAVCRIGLKAGGWLVEVWQGPEADEFGATEGEDRGGFLEVGEEEAEEEVGGGSVVLGKDAYDIEEASGGLRDDGDGLEDEGGGLDKDCDRFEEDVDGLEENVGGNEFELLELGGLDGDWRGVEENVGWLEQDIGSNGLKSFEFLETLSELETCCGLSVTELLFPESTTTLISLEEDEEALGSDFGKSFFPVEGLPGRNSRKFVKKDFKNPKTRGKIRNINHIVCPFKINPLFGCWENKNNVSKCEI